jgi:hypothetical protein
LELVEQSNKRPEARLAPNGIVLTPIWDDGMYQVYEGTIRKAAFVAGRTAKAWKEAAVKVPEGELRDHILAHRFDELFEVVPSMANGEPSVRVDNRKIYEIEQAILEQMQDGKLKNLGVVVKGVEIGKIEFPDWAGVLLLRHWGAPFNQQIDLVGAEGNLQARLLEAEGEQRARLLNAQSQLDAASLQAQTIIIHARADAQRRIMEGRSQAEARGAFFQSIVQALHSDGQPLDSDLIGAILKQLAATVASVDDLERYVNVQSRLSKQTVFVESNKIEINE